MRKTHYFNQIINFPCTSLKSCFVCSAKDVEQVQELLMEQFLTSHLFYTFIHSMMSSILQDSDGAVLRQTQVFHSRLEESCPLQPFDEFICV